MFVSKHQRQTEGHFLKQGCWLILSHGWPGPWRVAEQRVKCRSEIAPCKPSGTKILIQETALSVKCVTSAKAGPRTARPAATASGRLIYYRCLLGSVISGFPGVTLRPVLEGSDTCFWPSLARDRELSFAAEEPRLIPMVHLCQHKCQKEKPVRQHLWKNEDERGIQFGIWASWALRNPALSRRADRNGRGRLPPETLITSRVVAQPLSGAPAGTVFCWIPCLILAADSTAGPRPRTVLFLFRERLPFNSVSDNIPMLYPVKINPIL